MVIEDLLPYCSRYCRKGGTQGWSISTTRLLQQPSLIPWITPTLPLNLLKEPSPYHLCHIPGRPITPTSSPIKPSPSSSTKSLLEKFADPVHHIIPILMPATSSPYKIPPPPMLSPSSPFPHISPLSIMPASIASSFPALNEAQQIMMQLFLQGKGMPEKTRPYRVKPLISSKMYSKSCTHHDTTFAHAW